MLICTVDGCCSRQYRMGMCSIHYRRNLRHGDPLITKKRPNGAGYAAGGYTGSQINGVRKFDHVRIVEQVLGRPLGAGVVIHHWNEIKTDNRHENLLVCQDRAYHNLIHARMAAYDACGNANWRKCKFCKQYDDPTNLQIHGRGAYHSTCSTNYQRQNSAKKKEKENANLS